MASIVAQNTNFVMNFDYTQKKPQYTPSASIKKLLKRMRKLFKKSSTANKTSNAPVAELHFTCMTEEEHQNWLNMQLEINTAIAKTFAL